MAKKNAKKAAKKPAKAAKHSPPAQTVADPAPQAKGPWPPEVVIDIKTNQPVHLSVVDGKGLANSDGRLVHVEIGPNSDWFSMAHVARKFARRSADNAAFYSQQGFGTPLPDGFEAMDIGEIVS